MQATRRRERQGGDGRAEVVGPPAVAIRGKEVGGSEVMSGAGSAL